MLINNKEQAINAPTALAVILRELGFDPAKVAILVNGEIVPKNKLAETMVDDDASVEIVSFVGGG